MRHAFLVLMLAQPVCSLGIGHEQQKVYQNVVEITLKEKAAGSKVDFKLGDIALVNVADTQLKERLMQLRIGRMARVGYVQRITRNDVAARLEREFPGIYRTLTWKGADYTVIKTIGRSYAAAQYINAARESLEHSLGERYRDVQLNVKGIYKDLDIPHGVVQLTTRTTEAWKINARMCVWVDLAVNNEHYQSIPVWFSVKARARVLVAGREMKAGHIVNKDEFHFEYRDIAMLSNTPAVIEDLSEQRRVKSDLPTGGVLTHENLEPVPLVVAGQRISVRATVGNVTLMTFAVALQDGNEGDRIKVWKKRNNVTYTAIVVGKDLVLADGGGND